MHCGGDCINKRLMMLLILLIFFTGISSVCADSNASLDELNAAELSEFNESAGFHYSSKILSDSNSEDSDLSDAVSVAVSGESESYSMDLDDSLENEIVDENSVNSKKSVNLVLQNDNNVDKPIISESSNANPQYIKINSTQYYGYSNVPIQKIVEEANAGSTIEFTGSFYKNLHLNIDKPLNIISKCGTVINMSYDLPVFNIVNGGSGTNISGFVINSMGSFVDANDVSDIRIFNNKISSKNIAIKFEKVFDSLISKNLFSNFKTGIDISQSGGISISKNNLTPNSGYNVGINLRNTDDSKEIKIIDNILKGYDSRLQSTGISVGKNVFNVLFKGNSISNLNTGIDFIDSLNNVTVNNNTITKNGDGVVINGWVNGFNFTKNSVTNNARLGVQFDYDFLGSKTDPVFENNFFTHNGELDVRTQGASHVRIGNNFAKFLCARILMKKTFSLRIRTDGKNNYISVVDGNGRGVKDLPNFSANLNVGGKSYNLEFRNGVAYIVTDTGLDGADLTIGEENRQLSNWGQISQVTYDDLDAYIKEYLKNFQNENNEADNQNQSDWTGDDVINNHNSNSNSSSSSGSNSGSSSNNGGDLGISESSSSVNMNQLSSGASDGSAGSPSTSAPSSQSPASESATVKSLSVDDETFRVVGVGGLLLLIILVIGLYYREDIQEMMKD